MLSFFWQHIFHGRNGRFLVDVWQRAIIMNVNLTILVKEQIKKNSGDGRKE